MRNFLLLSVFIGVAGCATQSTDYNLMWDSSSARLHIFAPDGKEISPFAGELIGLSGYLFTDNGVKVLPGKKLVSYACPRTDGWNINDSLPGTYFSFEAGKEYELRCENGQPVVSARK